MSECKENGVVDIGALCKKVDDQSRFTRMLVVVCCLAVLAGMFYSLTSLVGVLPDLVLARIMGNLDSVHTEWRALEKLSSSKTLKPLR